MELFIAIWQDRHADTVAKPFTDKDEAIEWARSTAKRLARNDSDYSETEVEGWEFLVEYSCESDCIWIVKHELKV